MIVEKYKELYEKTGRFDKKFTTKAREWAEERTHSNENKIGLIAVLPNNDTYLKNLIRMIMEQHFDLNLEQCWICGSRNEKVDEKVLKIFSDSRIRIGEIKKILIKHSLNYHEDLNFDNKNSWNVVCPWCYGYF